MTKKVIMGVGPRPRHIRMRDQDAASTCEITKLSAKLSKRVALTCIKEMAFAHKDQFISAKRDELSFNSFMMYTDISPAHNSSCWNVRLHWMQKNRFMKPLMSLKFNTFPFSGSKT